MWLLSLVKIVSNFYVNINTVESCELQLPVGDMDFLIKQVNQITANQVSKQLVVQNKEIT